MNMFIDKAHVLPVRKPELILSLSSIMLPMAGREKPLELRITAPMSGDNLPIILLSHGHGPSPHLRSKDGYGPLANFCAEQGFAVIQPTHADALIDGLGPNALGAPLFWRERVIEMTHIIDQLNVIGSMFPILAGRFDHSRIAAVGHSLGGQTAGMLLGARLNDPQDENARDVDLMDRRVKAGVLLAAPGNGGVDLSEMATRQYSALNPDFSHLVTRNLVVVGDADVNPDLSRRGADWRADAYHHAPGADCLLTLFGAGHGLGGIAGYDARETDDEDADRLELTRRATCAYLRSALYEDDQSWMELCAALNGPAGSIGQVDRKVAFRFE